MTKKEQFKQAVATFKESQQTSEDYMELLRVSASVLRQGGGLMWSDVEAVLQEVVDK